MYFVEALSLRTFCRASHICIHSTGTIFDNKDRHLYYLIVKFFWHGSNECGILSLQVLCWSNRSSQGTQGQYRGYWWLYDTRDQAPVPLAIFQLNYKFNEILYCFCSQHNRPIATIFSHDSNTIVTYAKFCCDRFTIFQIRTLLNLIEFWIRSKSSQWYGRQNQ